MSRVKRSFLLKDFYSSYKIRCKEYGIEPKPYSTYREIILTMGDVMSDLLLESGIVAMPWMIGDVFLKEFDYVKPVVDHNTSKQLGKRVYFTNAHTGFKYYSAFWLSPERKSKKRKNWCFSLYRGTARRLVVLLKKGKKYPNYKLLNNRASA